MSRVRCNSFEPGHRRWQYRRPRRRHRVGQHEPPRHAGQLLGELLVQEQRRNLDLARAVLPTVIARRLKESPGVIADLFDECSVLFADLVGFTSHSTEVTPERLVTELNEV